MHLLLFFVLGTADVSPFLQRADEAMQAGDLKSASAQLQEALLNDPEHIDVLVSLALIELQQGQPKLAAARLRKVVELDPYNDQARLLLARAEGASGNQDAADMQLQKVLERHPEHTDATSLKKSLTLAPTAQPGAKTWAPQARAGFSMGYDSNLALESDLLPLPTEQAAALWNAELALAVAYKPKVRRLTLFARANTQSPVNNREDLKENAATVLGAGATARADLGFAGGALDLRYQEIFTNLFSTHRLRKIAPSIWLERDVSRHRLRLLTGAEMLSRFNNPVQNSSVLAKAGLRDTMRWSRFYLIVDATLRKDFADDPAGDVSDPIIAALGGFMEMQGSVIAGYAVSPKFRLFGWGQGQFRSFDAGDVSEQTYLTQAGMQYTLGSVELHTEYGFTKNTGEDTRAYMRHQISGGVRVWYQ